MCRSSGGLIARLVTNSPWTTRLWRSLFASLFPTVVLWMIRGRGFLAQWRDVRRPEEGQRIRSKEYTPEGIIH
jgi:hypothetical protein